MGGIAGTTSGILCAETKAEQEVLLAERRASSLTASTSQPREEGASGEAEGPQRGEGMAVEVCMTVTLPAEVNIYHAFLKFRLASLVEPVLSCRPWTMLSSLHADLK